VTADDAALEIQVRDWLRDSTGITAALGPHAADLLANEDATADAFGKASLAAAAEKFGITLPTGAVGAPLGPAASAPVTLAGWRPARRGTQPAIGRDAAGSGSLAGNTSFTLDAWLAAAQDFIAQAGSDTIEGGSDKKSETHTSTIDGVTEQLTLGEQITVSWGEGRVSLDVMLTSDSTFADATSGKPAGHKTTSAHGVFKLNGCPTADGVAEGHYTVDKLEGVTDSSGAAHGGESSIDGDFRATDDDGANLVGTEFNANVSTNGHGGSGGDFSLGETVPMQIAAGGAVTVGTGSNLSGNAAAGSSQAVGWLLAMAGAYLGKVAKEAEHFWRSGACIDMQTSRESGKVKPNEKIELTVTPIGKFDKGQINKPVEAVFSGAKSLDPSTPQTAPATFNFVAGPNKDDKGTIDLKQTSKRGIGKKTVVFTVGSGRLLVTISVTGSVTNSLGNVKGTMKAVKIPLESGELSDMGDGTMSETGTFLAKLPRGIVCSGAFSGSRQISLEAVRDPTDDTKLTLTFRSTPEPIPYKIKCPKPAPSYTLDAGEYGTGWLIPIMSPVDLVLGTPSSFSASSSGVSSTVAVTVVEEQTGN
jgi:hypothetical protein